VTLNSTNATYVLNTVPLAAAAAEAFCNDNGGHLASYSARRALLSC
jgi:hypothetical protein